MLHNLVHDGGFEETPPGPWSENNWAGNVAVFTRDPENPFRGHFSQRMMMTSAAANLDLQLTQRLDGLVPGGTLLVRLALRGRSNARPLQAEIRRIDSPYTTYGAIRIPSTTTWQTHSFVASLPTALPADGVGIFIHLKDESVAWVDDISVGILPERDPRGPLPGNLLANGSFEVGMARWTLMNRDGCPLPLVPAASESLGAMDGAVVEVPDAPDGRRVMRFAVRKHCVAYLDSAYLPYRYGHPITASARIRALNGSGPIELSLGHGESPNTVWPGKATVLAEQDWRTVSLTCIPGPSAGNRLFLQLFASAMGEYEVDAVRVAQDPATPTAAPSFGCATIDPPPAGIHRGAERPRLRVRASGLAANARVNASVRVNDAWERTVALSPIILDADAAGEAVADLALPYDRFGGFRCALEVGGRLEAEALYCMVPNLPRPDGSGRSFFGGHFRLNGYALDVAERAGMRWVRMHPPLDTKWMVAEPEPGKIAFQTSGVERAVARGFSVLGSLDTTPEWAATPGIAKPYTWWNSRIPRDWLRWSAYVHAAVRAFPGIRHWEVFNEPDCDFLTVPPEVDKAAAYSDLLARTRQALDDLAHTDPGLARVELIGLPVSSLDRPFFREVLARGGAGQVDSLAFHFYYEDLDPFEKRPDFLEQLATMRAARSRNGTEPGIWHTEGGIGLSSLPSWYSLAHLPRSGPTTQLDCADTLVRTAVALKALGLKRHFHYCMDNQASLVWRTAATGLLDLDGSARPAVAAHAAMVWLLDDADPLGAETMEVAGSAVRLASFRSPSRGLIRVAWSRTPVAASQVPQLIEGSSEVRDLMGNLMVASTAMVTTAPIYVITPAP